MKQIFLLAGIAFIMLSCGNNEKEYDATGTFEATEVTVSAKASGELKMFSVTEGESVKGNQTVGFVDSYQLRQKQDELTAAGLQLDANIAATDSRQLDLQKQLASISQQITNAQYEQKRFAELVKDGAVPRKQLDDINNQIKVLPNKPALSKHSGKAWKRRSDNSMTKLTTQRFLRLSQALFWRNM